MNLEEKMFGLKEVISMPNKTKTYLSVKIPKNGTPEFTVAPQKKLKTLSADFKKAFNLSLVFYKGVQIADGELTLADGYRLCSPGL